MRAPLDHGTVGAEEVAPPHWLQSRSDGHMNLWCDSSNSLFFFVLLLILQPGLLLSSTISLKNLLMSSLATLSTGPTSNRTWDTNEQCKVKCEMQCSAMFLHLNNPAGKSLPDGKTCTAVHPLFALNKTTMIWSRSSSSSSSQSRS